MMSEHTIPAPLEMKILQALWRAGAASTVQELCDNWVPPEDRPGYTTVLKKLQVMEEKGFIGHEKDGKAYRYQPLLAREEVEGRKWKEVQDGLFEGDRLSFVLGFMKHSGITPDELAQARRLLDELEAQEGEKA